MSSLLVMVMGHMARKEGSKLLGLYIAEVKAKHSVLATKWLLCTTQLAPTAFPLFRKSFCAVSRIKRPMAD